jgi:hypothetical protein
MVLEILAGAYVAAGRLPEAISTSQRALELARAAGNKDLAKTIQERIRIYERQKSPRRSVPFGP